MLQFDVCCKAIDQNFICGCDCCAILRLDLLFLHYACNTIAMMLESLKTIACMCSLITAAQLSEIVLYHSLWFA